MADRTAYSKLESDHDAALDAQADELALNVRPSQRAIWLSYSSYIPHVLMWVILACNIATLILSRGERRAPRGAKEPLEYFGYTDVVFMNDSRYANEDAFLSEENMHHTLSQWVPLSSKGRGYVKVPQNERKGLDKPYLLNPLFRPIKDEVYMTSSMHQLHCLSTIMNSYGKLRRGEDESLAGYHIAHCFDYLRQGILCAGDSTLEGNNSMKYPHVEIPWGTTHQCKNWDALRDWADEHTVWEYPTAMDTL